MSGVPLLCLIYGDNFHGIKYNNELLQLVSLLDPKLNLKDTPLKSNTLLLAALFELTAALIELMASMAGLLAALNGFTAEL